MQCIVLFEALDGLDSATICLHSECRTGLDEPAIQDDRAGAAKARVAADVCARKAEFFAYEFDQQGAWLDVSLVSGTVDRDVDEDELCVFRHNGALP
jgi:hypothetical protein